jgi:hypothetical protein
MPTKENRIGRIEVRFIQDFFSAPAVYTFLAAMPAVERSRLIVSLLEKHIRETQHPAGDEDVQLRMVAGFLSKGKQQESSAEFTRMIGTHQSLEATAATGARHEATALDRRVDQNPDGNGTAAHAESSPPPNNGRASDNEEASEPVVKQETSTSTTSRPLSSMVSRWITE